MNGVLVDTSVWVDHFRHRNEQLVGLLPLDLAFSHPLILTELACGTPPAPRSRTLADIATLPQARQATPGSRIWSADRSLAQLAQRFGVAFRPAHA